MSLEPEFIARLVTLETVAGLAELDAAGFSTVENAHQLALWALDAAEADSASASHTLALATALSQQIGSPPALRGQLDYAQARISLQQGNLSLAESSLRAAQSAWREAQDNLSLSRSQLGLTQILTMQGRYAEAEQTCRQAITELQSLVEEQRSSVVPLLIARNNLASQLLYQERHHDAISEADLALSQIALLLADSTRSAEIGAQLRYWQGYLLINKATGQMSLNLPNEAETSLVQASELFQQIGDELLLGRAQANLGALFARTGRYADALRQFDIASQLLLGEGATPAAADLARSELLLDRANTYLALNLLTEAGALLQRCEVLYRTADQPYELAQSLFLHGLLRYQNEDYASAQTLFVEAERLFAGLQNELWQNRVALAMAALDAQLQHDEIAAVRLDALLSASDDENRPLHWDIATLTEARLLRLRLYLRQSQIEAAQSLVTAIAHDLQSLPLPHLELRLQHARGQIETAQGNWQAARNYLQRAVDLLEAQRASLTIEEVRTAFLDDKASLYADLVLALLEESTPQGIDDAFAVVERARSRALLERLMTALSSEESVVEDFTQSRRAELQQQLHWLYNRLLNDPGSRRIDANIDEEIRWRELALQQLEWQRSPQLLAAQPVGLETLRGSLALDQQAIVYFIAGNEVMAFVIDRNDVRLQRHLCSRAQLQAAQQEWRFQLGRAEMAPQYMHRHANRFEEAWRNALYQLYRLLVEPLSQWLTGPHLLMIPYGSLHLVPFHALWDGEAFLLQRFEISFAPSASLAVQIGNPSPMQQAHRSLAALAITDPAIPAARDEVEAAARHFPSALVYIDEEATLEALQQAARLGDVLHIATHGLFRPDNAFFSALKLADGWVDVRQLYRLPLAAQLVVLSACESGAGHVHGGDEVIGLARGFLGAGAETVVASLWNVHDASSAALMADFYGELAGKSPISALRAAQLAAIERQKHPYYWASYFVIGK